MKEEKKGNLHVKGGVLMYVLSIPLSIPLFLSLPRIHYFSLSLSLYFSLSLCVYLSPALSISFYFLLWFLSPAGHTVYCMFYVEALMRL